MKTIYSILIISFFIGYTSAQERDSIVGGWEYPQNFYELYRLNAKGEKLTTHSNVFIILKKRLNLDTFLTYRYTCLRLYIPAPLQDTSLVICLFVCYPFTFSL